MDPLKWLSFYKEHPALSFVGFLIAICVMCTAYFGIKIPSDQEYELKSMAMVCHAGSQCDRIDAMSEKDRAALQKVIQADLVPFANYVKKPWMLGCISFLVVGLILIMVLDERLRRARSMTSKNIALKEEIALLRASLLQQKLNYSESTLPPRGFVFKPRNPRP